MRRAAKIDANHVAIVKALRQIGCRVLSLAAVGHGCPDLLVLRQNRLVLVEVKDGAKSPSKRRLTSQQEIFHEFWPVLIVTSPEDAISQISALQK